MTNSSNHTTIQNRHPRSLIDLNEVNSNTLSFSLEPRPTRRYLKKLALKYMCCPDCESKYITYYGNSSMGTQKHLCKECGYQFVAQFDAYFPRSKRRFLFEQEYLHNLQRQGFKEGTGRKEFWEGALQMTLTMIESQIIKVRINRMLKTMQINCEREYQLLVEFIVHDAYVRVIG